MKPWTKRCADPRRFEAIEGVVDHVSPSFLGVRSGRRALPVHRLVRGRVDDRAPSVRRGRGPAGGRGGLVVLAHPRVRPATATLRARLTALPRHVIGGAVAPERTSPTANATQERTRVSRLLKSHAPPDWERRFRATELLDAVIDGEPIQMFVMAADIRESTTLMKESREVRALRHDHGQVRELGARWGSGVRVAGSTSSRATGSSRTGSCSRPRRTSTRNVSSRPRATSRTPRTSRSTCSTGGSSRTSAATPATSSAGVGLSMGLDAGPGYLVKIARRAHDRRTARRRLGADGDRGRDAQEIVANVYLGERLREGQDGVYEAPRRQGQPRVPPDQGIPEGPGRSTPSRSSRTGPELETSDEDAEVGMDVVDVSDATGDGDGKAS